MWIWIIWHWGNRYWWAIHWFRFKCLSLPFFLKPPPLAVLTMHLERLKVMCLNLPLCVYFGLTVTIRKHLMAWVGVYSSSSFSPDPQLKILEFRVELGKVIFLPWLKWTKIFFFCMCGFLVLQKKEFFFLSLFFLLCGFFVLV